MCIIRYWCFGKKLYWSGHKIFLSSARFAVGGQVVAIIGVFALDSNPLFHVSSPPLNTTSPLMLSSKGWGSREWVISFMVALVWILFTFFGKLPPSLRYWWSNGMHTSSQVGIMGSILMTKAVCWVTPSKVMVVRSFEVVAAYVLQVPSKYIPLEHFRSIDWEWQGLTRKLIFLFFFRSPYLMCQATGQTFWERAPSFRQC